MTDAMDRVVGRRILEARVAAGLTQSELADHIGVWTQSIAKIEAGQDRIKAGQLWLAAERLGVPIDDLFRDTGHLPTPAQRRFARAARGVPADLIEPLARLVKKLGR